jgi:Arc/MetJ-type ribon-helix-helix transcriptional regulator
MSDDEITSLTIRLPAELREKIRRQAKAEERSESQFVRYHLSQFLQEAAATAADEPEPAAMAGS